MVGARLGPNKQQWHTHATTHTTACETPQGSGGSACLKVSFVDTRHLSRCRRRSGHQDFDVWERRTVVLSRTHSVDGHHNVSPPDVVGEVGIKVVGKNVHAVALSSLLRKPGDQRAARLHRASLGASDANW